MNLPVARMASIPVGVGVGTVVQPNMTTTSGGLGSPRAAATLCEPRRRAVGTVSKVRHRHTGVEYALKTIELKGISPGVLKEIHNEIEILKRLDHPYIIRE